jgi:hypothetical protein
MESIVDYYTSRTMNDGKAIVYCGFSSINNAYLVWRNDNNVSNDLLIHSEHDMALEDFNDRIEFARMAGVLD